MGLRMGVDDRRSFLSKAAAAVLATPQFPVLGANERVNLGARRVFRPVGQGSEARLGRNFIIEVDGDRATLITGVLGFYLSSKAQFRIAYEHQSFQGDAPSISGVRTALTVNF